MINKEEYEKAFEESFEEFGKALDNMFKLIDGEIEGDISQSRKIHDEEDEGDGENE